MTGESKIEKRDALEYRAAYLANIEACHFPTFGSEIESAKRRLSTKVPLLHATDIEKLATDSGLTLPSLLRAAWGLVLRCYTGKDDVCFGYLETGRNNPVDGAHKTAENYAGMAIVRMLFDEAISLNEIVEKSQEDYVKGLPYHHFLTADNPTDARPKERQLFNTALMLRNDLNTATAAKAATPARSTGVGGAEEVSDSQWINRPPALPSFIGANIPWPYLVQHPSPRQASQPRHEHFSRVVELGHIDGAGSEHRQYLQLDAEQHCYPPEAAAGRA